ncbi:MAG: response regulator [Proteobacteria bacterium]|nr:response regulator [Pseudomonadota bacterium]MBU1717067.1 response regulator [Pseudomonadota bacterium]
MIRIAIVDDSETARMFIRRCLEIVGFSKANFIEADNGKDALEKIKKTPVDLILTDLTMPVMDGETLLKWIKSNPKLCEIPVLVITSAGNPAKESELIKIGAIGVLPKPISPAKLNTFLAPFMKDKEEEQ